MKVVHCRDVGMDCDAVARGATEEELLTNAAEHVASAHGVKELPPELVAKVRAAIKDE